MRRIIRILRSFDTLTVHITCIHPFYLIHKSYLLGKIMATPLETTQSNNYARYSARAQLTRSIYALAAYICSNYKRWLYDQYMCGFNSRCCGKAIDACVCFVSPRHRSFTASRRDQPATDRSKPTAKELSTNCKLGFISGNATGGLAT